MIVLPTIVITSPANSAAIDVHGAQERAPDRGAGGTLVAGRGSCTGDGGVTLCQ
jgi:hypothetical protein